MEFLTELLPHQVAAVDKLKKLKVGALFMEQGTGKTRTALELIQIRLNKERITKVLWLCPCSVKENLLRDIEKHTGSRHQDLIKVCGIESLSNSVRINSECLDYVKNNKVYLIVDESILIKTFWAERSKNIQRLAEICTYKMILNGTPISKNEADLFGQFYLLDWRILGYKSWWSFSRNHLERDERTNKVVRCLNVDYLTNKIAPYTYEVKKKDCLELPKKKQSVCYCNITDSQRKEYERVGDMLLMDVDELRPSTIYRFFSGLQAVISGLYVNQIYQKGEPHIVTIPMFNDPYDNPRIQCLLKEITDEKTIIFCKYTHEIESVIKVLKEKFGDCSCVGFYGDIKQKQRQKNLKVFEFNNECKYLVANKSCAGFGLNLQFCHNLIYYSNDWTLGTRLQSEDRLHRIGQSQEVNIIDIVAWGTLDERIMSCLKKKKNILSDITDSLKDKNAVDFKSQLQEMFLKQTARDKSTIKVGEVIKKNLEEGEAYENESISEYKCV